MRPAPGQHHVEFIFMSGKVTLETVRRLASTLPGAEESTHWRGTSFKVNGRMLACQAIHKSAEPNSLVLRIDMDQREALIAEDPDTYYITDHYKNYPSVLVRLSRVSPDAMRDLLQTACRFVTGGNKSNKPVASREQRARPKRVRRELRES